MIINTIDAHQRSNENERPSIYLRALVALLYKIGTDSLVTQGQRAPAGVGLPPPTRPSVGVAHGLACSLRCSAWASLASVGAVAGGMSRARPLRRSCATVAESMAWATHGIARAKALGLEELVAQWSTRPTTTSSICSGIMAPELALCMGARAAGGEGQPLWAVEHDRQLCFTN